MEFLHLGLLPYFLPLAAIPIVLHLLTLHRLKTVELSTFRFLFDSYVQQRRRMKFLEALIALLRTLFLLFLVLPALVLGTEDFRIPKRFVQLDAIEYELKRFHSALDAVCNEISGNQELATTQLGSQYGAIFGAHLQMIRDPKLVAEIEEQIREKCHSPEFDGVHCSLVM